MHLKCPKHERRVHVLEIGENVKAFHQTRNHVPCDSRRFTYRGKSFTAEEIIAGEHRVMTPEEILLHGIFTGAVINS